MAGEGFGSGVGPVIAGDPLGRYAHPRVGGTMVAGGRSGRQGHISGTSADIVSIGAWIAKKAA